MVLAGLARCRAGVVCGVFAQRVTGDFVTGEAKQQRRGRLRRDRARGSVQSWPNSTGRSGGGRRAVATVDLAEAPETDAERAAPRRTRGRGGTRPVAEAYCVKDKMKVEVQNPDADHDEERQARDSGHVPEVRRQGLQDRRLAHAGQTRGRRPSGEWEPAQQRDRSRGPASPPASRDPPDGGTLRVGPRDDPRRRRGSLRVRRGPACERVAPASL